VKKSEKSDIMELIEAIKARHSVRKYLDKPIEPAQVATLRTAIERINAENGLNTCWVGLTYKKIPGTFTLRDGDVLHCVISLGYGATPGVQHPQKRSAEDFYESEGLPPEWFLKGMEAALLAPTATNQQKFKFILHPDNAVEAKTVSAMSSYLNVDLGIVKYHFEAGAGKDNFHWVN